MGAPGEFETSISAVPWRHEFTAFKFAGSLLPGFGQMRPVEHVSPHLCPIRFHAEMNPEVVDCLDEKAYILRLQSRIGPRCFGAVVNRTRGAGLYSESDYRKHGNSAVA